jgi:DNA-binding MarR family transcriptional regulator
LGVVVRRSRWLTKREARIWQSYRDVRRELQGAFHLQLSREDGMSAADYAVMVPLSEAPNGQLRTKALGGALGWDRSRTSHQVTRMVKRGLVSREFCEDDGRGSVVGLTPAGRAAIEKAAPKHVALVRQLFIDPLSDDELDTLGVLLDRLLAGIRQYTAEQPQEEGDDAERRPNRGRAKRRTGIERHVRRA